MSRSSSPQQCQTCQELYPFGIEDLPAGQPAALFLNLSDLKSTIASSGCESCCLIRDALLPEYEQRQLSWNDATGPLELRIECGKPLRLLDRVNAIYLEIFSENGGSSLPNIGHASYRVEADSSSVQCHNRIKSWLKDCDLNHEKCPSKQGRLLPTRVVNVGLVEGRESQFEEPRLMETTGGYGRYAALSYCWGKNPNTFKTTSDTIASHKRGIQIASLPKTIQDAVAMTRILQIPYLWVDALCIIQGDAEDWAREAGKMCKVYRNAELTISAANSASNNEGIFGPQRFGAPAQSLMYRGSTFKVCQNIAREHNRLEVQMCMPEPLPITRRAWTLQESALSNRIIYYTRNELVWECNEAYLCECGFGNIKLEANDEYSSRTIRQPELAQGMELKVAYKRWRDMVMVFSERQLSVDSDKLAAISGLARQFKDLFSAISANGSNRYIAGLWTNDIAHSLLWEIEDDWFRQSRDLKFEFRRPASWRAPSWSWAAVEGPIDYPPLARLESMVEVVDVKVIPKTTHDAMGQVSSAALVLKGKFVTNVSIIAEKGLEAEHRRDHVQGVKYQASHEGGRYDILPDDLDGPPLLATYCCLLVGQIKWWGPKQCFFLVLKRTDAIPATYERVGVSCLGSGSSINDRLRAHFPMFDHAPWETITLV